MNASTSSSTDSRSLQRSTPHGVSTETTEQDSQSSRQTLSMSNKRPRKVSLSITSRGRTRSVRSSTPSWMQISHGHHTCSPRMRYPACWVSLPRTSCSCTDTPLQSFASTRTDRAQVPCGPPHGSLSSSSSHRCKIRPSVHRVTSSPVACAHAHPSNSMTR